jgi:hypothetical protein
MESNSDSDEIHTDGSDNITGNPESNHKYYSMITFESSMNTIFYYMAGELTPSAWQWCILYVYYDTATGEPTSAQLKLTGINEQESEERAEIVATNDELSKFLSNPIPGCDEEMPEDDYNRYYVLADVDLSKADINSFIEAYYLTQQDVYALQREVEDRYIEGSDEFGENYTYDAYQDIRIEWFE